MPEHAIVRIFYHTFSLCKDIFDVAYLVKPWKYASEKVEVVRVHISD